MAEGGTRQRSFKDSFGKASGDADEAFCDPCKSEGKWVAVEGYCQVCHEYMCDTCLGVHKKQKLSKGHAILDKTCMPTSVRSSSSQVICVDVCKTHHPEIIKYYCKAHDVPGCADCMTLNHQTCERKRIQDISDGYEKTQEFKHIDQELQQLYQDIKDLGDDLNSNLNKLDRSYADILKKIKAARKQVNDYLDQMEQQVTDEAAQMKKQDTIELNKFITECKAMKTEVEDLLDSIHKSNVNVNTLFVTTKQAKQRLASMEREINNIRQQQQQQQYEFEISTEIRQIVSAKTPLGELSRKVPGAKQQVTTTPVNKSPSNPANKSTSNPAIKSTSNPANKSTSNPAKKSTSNPANKSTSNPNKIATANPAIIATADRASGGHGTSTPLTKVTTTYNSSINVKCKEDNYTCWITDSTIMNKDMLVITDWANWKVKLINTRNNTVITSFTTPSGPHGVTAPSKDMIAVTLPFMSKILLLKVTSSSITKHSEIELRGLCHGIAHKEGKLAVSYRGDPGRVEILEDIQGKVLHEIKPQDTNDKFKEPDFILFGRDSDTVIVSDRLTNKVSEITFGGQILHTYTHHALVRPLGIVMTEDGLLFVCSWKNGCVHVISENFKSSKVIINQDQHVVYPYSITYCENKHRLYISNHEYPPEDMYNKIQVFDLNV